MNQLHYRHCGNGRNFAAFRNDCNEQVNEIEVDEFNEQFQKEEESIIIRESCCVKVKLRDMQTAQSIQGGLQTVLVALLTLELQDTEKAIEMTEKLLQMSKIKQISKQKVLIERSKNVLVESSDMQAASNIQALLQLVTVISERIAL